MLNQLTQFFARLLRLSPYKGMDFHTAFILRLIQLNQIKYQQIATHQIPKPYTKANPQIPTKFVSAIGETGIEIPEQDDDSIARPKWLRKIVRLNNKYSPFVDHKEIWSNADFAKSTILEVYAGTTLPQPETNWDSPTTDESTARFVLQGIGAHHLERATEEEGGGFVLKMAHMEKFAVRENFMPYGGNAFVSTDGKLQYIHMRGKNIMPHDPSWELTKFIFRTTTLVYVTIIDHLITCHYGIANALVLATKRCLSLDHPLRAFLAPFHYHTAAINSLSLDSLFDERGLLQRLSGFTKEALQELCKNGFSAQRLERFPEKLHRQGIHPSTLTQQEQDMLPFVVDGLAYWNCVELFIHEAFKQSTQLNKIFSTPYDRQTQAWWQELQRWINMPLPSLEQESLITTLCTIIFSVTGLHHHIGHAAPYVRDPTFAGGRVVINATVTEVQNSFQACTATLATGFSVPLINGDFTHLMPDIGAKRAAIEFQNHLMQLQQEIDTRNLKREQPFMSFSPNKIPCSVSR